MSSENIRQPITIVSEAVLYDNDLKLRFRLLSAGVISVFIIAFCCPVLILINTLNQTGPITTSKQMADATTTKTIIPTLTARPRLPTSTPRAIKTATSEHYPVAEISCANNVYKVNLRRTPGYVNKNDSSDSIYEIPCGEVVELLGETKNVDGLKWWRVRWNAYTGWVADHTASGKVILIFNP